MRRRSYSARWPTAPVTEPGLPPEERSSAPEFYGFVALTSTYLLFVLYLLWALLPDKYIVALGITWYPNREWAILIPSWTVILVILTYITYSAIAINGQPAFDEMRSVADTRVALPDDNAPGARNAYIVAGEPNAIPHLYDIPIGLVNRVLYHEALSRRRGGSR